MSETFDPSLVEQTRQQVRAIVGEITKLSKLDISPEEYHTEFLNRSIAAMGAVGGIFWKFDEGALKLAYQVNARELQLQENPEANQQHARLLYKMLHGPDTGTLVPPYSSITSNDEKAQSAISGNPSALVLLFAPVRTELEAVGLVEVFLRPETNAAAQRNLTNFLSQVCIQATDYYKNRQLRHFGERQSLWTQLEEFTRSVHRNLDVNETGYTIVNEGRRLIECDRVSLALKYGGKCRIIAVSGQDVVDKRSTTIKLLGKLASAVVRAGEPVWFTGDTANFAPQVEKAIDLYVDEAQTKMIAVYPLTKKSLNKDGDPKKRTKPETPFGALIVEQIEDSRIPERMKKRVEITAEHGCSALGNALEHRSIFLMPLWKTLGKTKLLFTAQTLPKTLLVSALIAAVVCAFAFLPWDFQMYCNGTLEPVIRQKIYAPLDGEVEKLFVAHNTLVQGPSVENGTAYRGTTLLQLRSSQLDQMGIELLGKRKEIVEQIASLNRQLLDQDKRLSEAERTELDGRWKQAEIQLASNKEQYEIYLQQTQNLYITSPIDGTVVSWDVEQRLTVKRPISRMQYVMEVAKLDGKWQLELAMPEKKMGNIAEYQQRFKSGEKLRVQFVLATDPSITYYGTVSEIHDRAEVRTNTGSAASSQNGLNSVLIKAALDDPDSLPKALRPGAECSARVDCGKKPLGYVIFYEMIAFVQKNILFRFF